MGAKFSYSKLNTYDSCAFKYYLTYEEKHYFYSDSIATELGVAIHHCEEQIAIAIQNGEKPDYDKLKDELLNINIPKTSAFDTKGGIFGINILKEKYKKEFYEVDEYGSSYKTRTDAYLDYGIYRLEEYLNENPDLRVYGMEKYFSMNYNGQVLSGYIDRIFKNIKTGEYIIEDIKTKAKPFKDQELVTPLQFVVYTLALSSMEDIDTDLISCVYDLPLCNMKQPAGTKGYIKRGKDKLDEIFSGIQDKKFDPSPTPLCAWCAFCPNNPDQPEEAKFLCPYYSLWTRSNKTFSVSNKWRGFEHYQEDIEKEKAKAANSVATKEFDFEF